MITRRCINFMLVCACVLGTTLTQAEVKLADIFSSGMVLQQGMPVPVWGWADEGETVTISFAGQTKSTIAKNGKWMVKLDPLKASAEGRTISVKGNNNFLLEDVLVGEVWICSGQSNMEWSVKNSLNPKEEIANAKHPNIRIFNVNGHTIAHQPNEKLTGKQGPWRAVTPESITNFSAVGYYFGRRLHKQLNVPIGLVGSNWGGTRIEPWVSPDGFKSVADWNNYYYKTVLETAEKKPKINHGHPSAIYNSMVAPLAPFAMRGAIWYQGESNGNEGDEYYHKKKALVNGWRKLFNPDLAFYWVQLANFRNPNPNPEGGDGWARLREAQRKALSIPHTGMAVIHDIGDAKDIHPRNKQDVGSRLAQWALHQTYKMKNLVPAGPLYKSQKIEGNTIRLSFDHVGSGLMVGKKSGLNPTEEDKGGKLQHFAIAGKDKKWYWATATIDGDSVIVSAKEVKEPVAVRYGYTINPGTANLYNKEGIPASPFRTDNW